MKLTMFIVMLFGLSTFAFSQTTEPAATTTTQAPKGVPSDANPLKEIKPGKKHVKSTHLKVANAKTKHKMKKKKHH